MTEQQPKSERERAIEWSKQQLEVAIDELARLGIVDGPSVEGRVAWMLPFKVLIAELRETGQKQRALWVIAGDVPTDQIDARLAETPRDAARHFSLKWQMHAARQDPTAGDLAVGPDLAVQAEALNLMVETDDAWL
jgi:Domain of unknown function (DUF4826)